VSADAVTLLGRFAAERLMTTTCSVGRPTDEFVTNPNTGVDTPLVRDVPVRGVCKVQAATPQAASPEAGGAVFTVERLQIHLPVGDPVRVGDVVTVLDCPLDAGLNGLVFRLTELVRGSFRTAQRWDSELITR
jgi:hypothetical protein